ncbi:helix-turn-helix domain-containing protein [Pseudonocardia sp. GCM10023141]|uniref:helix-turn-helix domain-containing protein n=1 Tax=Pseudonocardia sp. GCM10023141 TaxID=3252653 RepID=UPI00360CDDB6
MGHDERQRAGASARSRLPELIRDTVAAVEEAVPAYRGLDAEQHRELHAITSWVLRRLLDAWAGDVAFDDEDRRRFRAIGGARGEDGRPVAAVLRAYRVAAVTATDLVLDAGGDTLDPGDVRALARTVLMSMDELSESVLAGYAAARDRLTGDRDRALRDLLDDLLAGRHTSPGVLASRCRELDVTLPPAPLLLVVDAATAAELLPSLGLVAGPGQEHLATVRDRRTVLLLPDRVAGAVEPALRGRGWRGCLLRAVTSGPAALRLAVDALDTAPEHAFHRRVLLDDGDAQLLTLLTARPGADPAAVVRSVLGPLTEPGNRHLLDGLAGFLSTGSASGAAELLHLHPQTLRYRLRRVTALTGRDPRDAWQRLALDVARSLAQVADHSSR